MSALLSLPKMLKYCFSCYKFFIFFFSSKQVYNKKAGNDCMAILWFTQMAIRLLR